MRFRVFGPLEVRHDGGSLDIGGRQPRRVLAALLAASGAPVTTDALIEVVWGDDPPESATAILQTYVSRLRRVLARFGPAEPTIIRDLSGYSLPVAPDDVDVLRFERLAGEGAELLAADRLEHAYATLDEALRLVRGPVWADVADHPMFEAQVVRIRERCLAAQEDHLDTGLRLGRHGEVLGRLAEAIQNHPLRERPRALFAVALYRDGRQAEALSTLAEGARLLRDELGIEPDPRLRELEARILRQDPTLDAPTRDRPASPADAPAVPTPAEETNAAAGGTPLARLVGRDRELASLVEMLDAAGADLRVAIVEGDPGIGKTRLADELRAIAVARGSLAVWGRTDEGGAAPGLWPWLPVFRALDAHRPEGCDTPPLTSLVEAEMRGPSGQGVALRHERFEAVAQNLELAGAERPVLVLLDDLQWADLTSLELLTFLSSRVTRGVMVLATVRPISDDRLEAVADTLAIVARREGSRRMILGGLDRRSTRELLPSIDGRPVPREVADTIHDRSEGNPFYALELSRLLCDEGSVQQDVPANVRDAIRQRMRQLPEETRDLLAVAAVLGRDVDLQLLPVASGLTALACLDLLDPALAQRWLLEVPEQPTVLRFQHALVREVLVESLTSLQRARHHLRVAEAIEARGPDDDAAEILADHLWHAVAIAGAERAALALEHAAEVALGRVAFASAERLLRRAARLRRSVATDDASRRRELDTLVRFLEVVLATRYFGGVDKDALARAQDLAKQFEDDSLERALYWYQWAGHSVGADNAETGPLARAFGERYADDPRPDVQALALELDATAAWTDGRITNSVAGYDRSVAILDTLPPPKDGLELEQRLVTYTFRATLHAYRGDWTFEQVIGEFERLIEEWPPIAAPSIYGFAATSSCYLGQWEAVGRYAELALQADPASQFAFWGGQFLMHRAVALAHQGRLDKAVDSFHDGLEKYLAVSALSGVPTFAASVAQLLAEHGDVPRAVKLLEDARGFLRLRDERWNEPIVLLAEGVVQFHAGDLEAADAKLRDAIEVAEHQGAHGLVPRVQATRARLQGLAWSPTTLVD